ncbi:MAG: putative PEP-binding protein [Vulcanimicrobiaceae bacterium]
MVGVAHGNLWMPEVPPANARAGTLDDFHSVRERFVRDAEELPADLRTMYQALAADPAWDDGITAELTAGKSLGEAIAATARQTAGALAAIEDPYLRARGDDIIQLGAQFSRLLGGDVMPPPGSILCASDVSAVELQAWSSRLAGVVLLDVSLTSHLAIVARGLGRPAIMVKGEAASRLRSAARGETAVLDAFGAWIETPAADALREQHPPQHIEAQPDLDSVTVGGRRIGVFANINAPDEALFAARLGADGVGLVRTEFLYTGRTHPPSLDEERAAYRRIAAQFQGRPVIVRTLDLGGDKLGGGLTDDGLDHGMLGIRGIRLMLQHPDQFARHVRAIVDGFAGTALQIMFPMVAIPEEFARARDVVRAVVAEAGIAKMPSLGFMVEIPAAAYALDVFAREGATFVSLGTNDLQQYFFATSRLDANVSAPRESLPPGWLRFLRDTVAKAKEAGFEVGVCGEAAGDPRLSSFWLEAGVDELSVTPGLIPWLKDRLRTLNIEPST